MDVSVVQWVSVAGSGSCTNQQKAVKAVSIVHVAAILKARTNLHINTTILTLTHLIELNCYQATPGETHLY